VPVAPGGAPKLGEHTRTVLHDLLDLSDRELDRLATEGVI
jgi:crotonobetainyl-CoA:carnitine CoA-transferase CaiB-like acyl-CoA transferase